MAIAYIMMAVAIFSIAACIWAYFDARASRTGTHPEQAQL
jgi:heme/copper-type cytochrome/quinol oxidase subunit 3